MVVVVGDDHAGQGAGEKAPVLDGVFQKRQGAGIAAVHQDQVLTAADQRGKEGLPGTLIGKRELSY